MKAIDIINQHIRENKKFFSIEITPPYKNKSIDPLFSTIERLLPYKPAFINITYHPLKVLNIKIDGVDHEIAQKKHVNPIGLCAAVKYKYNVEVVPHFVCAGLDKLQVEDILFDYAFLGLENILALRGDAATANETFKPVDGGYQYANELVTQINNMKKPIFINNIENNNPIDFCIGVAAHPEKHYQANSLEEDIINLKKKIDAGADYIITQMTFDTVQFEKWMNLIKQKNINVPVIPGIKPVTSLKQVYTMRNNYHVNVPDIIENLLNKAKTKEEAYEQGIDFASTTAKIFLETGAAGIHFFTIGNGKDIEDVVKRVF